MVFQCTYCLLSYRECECKRRPIYIYCCTSSYFGTTPKRITETQRICRICSSHFMEWCDYEQTHGAYRVSLYSLSHINKFPFTPSTLQTPLPKSSADYSTRHSDNFVTFLRQPAMSESSFFFYGPPHGLTNYKDTKAKWRNQKMTCKGTLRQVFIRVYRLEI